MFINQTEALESLAARIGLPMIRVSAGRAPCGRVIRNDTPKIDISIRALRAAVPVDRVTSVGNAMVAHAATVVSNYAGMNAESIRREIEEDAALTPVKSTAPIRRISVAMAEIAATFHDHSSGEIEALRVLAEAIEA